MSASLTEATGMTAYRAGSNAVSTAVSRVRGASPAPIYTAGSPSGTVSWSDGGAGGSFQLSGSGNSVAAYTPKNKTQVVTITATDASNSRQITLNVTATLPLYPQVGNELELDQETKIKKARDMTQYSREDGSPEVGYLLSWENRTGVDKTELMTFWYDHKKTKLFYYIDREGNLLTSVKFTSSFKAAFNGGDRFAMSAAIRGVYTGTVSPI